MLLQASSACGLVFLFLFFFIYILFLYFITSFSVVRMWLQAVNVVTNFFQHFYGDFITETKF